MYNIYYPPLSKWYLYNMEYNVCYLYSYGITIQSGKREMFTQCGLMLVHHMRRWPTFNRHWAAYQISYAIW